MIYKKFKNLQLSALGLGTMRLPVLNNNYSQVDEELTKQMVDYAIAHGINYFDTAWGYHDGASEVALGKALKTHPREKVYIATKFPGYDLANMSKVDEIFNKQLEKLGVDYIDFYLFHNVCEMNIEEYLDESYHIFEYLLTQKRLGKIKYLGFSAHGSYDVIKRFLEAYGDEMEFCQIQLNWLDWKFQDAKAKVELLREYNLPIWVMEPLRGGRLVNLTASEVATLKQLRPHETIPAWSFRFLQTIPEVTVTLSGMSNIEQLQDNIETFNVNNPLTKIEFDRLLKITDEMLSKKTYPCTGCRYCTSHCPMGIDIPEIIKLYNEHIFTGGGFIAPMALQAIPTDKRPSACLGCQSCEAVCPQQIEISKIMTEFSSKIER